MHYLAGLQETLTINTPLQKVFNRGYKASFQ